MTRWLFVGALIVVAGVAIGYVSVPPTPSPAYREQVYQTIEEQREQLPFVARMEFFRILGNNCRVVLVIELGIVTLGAAGGFVLLLNGIKVGILYRTALLSGVGWKLWLSHLIPHGISEYTAFVLAEAAAIQGGRYLWQRLNRQSVTVSLRRVILAALACYLIVLLAAMVEVYVTPFL